MKEKIIAVVLLVGVLSAVTINTFVIDRQVTALTDMINELDVTDEEAQEKLKNIQDKYEQKKDYISITVSHEDLTSVEECFVELTGYISDGQATEAEITKNRLLFYLEHIRRLSGFNIDSII